METGDTMKNEEEMSTTTTEDESDEVKAMRLELAESQINLAMMNNAFLNCIRERNRLQRRLDGGISTREPEEGQLFDIRPPYWVAFTGSNDACYATLELLNLSYRQDAYFRIKSTHPEAYRVCPTHGVISPGFTKLIVIELCHAADIDHLKHSKFMVQSAGIPPDLSSQDLQEIWKELSNRGQFQYQKLPVTFHCDEPTDDGFLSTSV